MTHPRPCNILSLLLLTVTSAARADALPAVEQAIAPFIEKQEIAGAVTAVVAPDRIVHLAAQGYADLERKTPMRDDALFWIASMTKPITGVAIVMLHEQGKLSIDNPAAKYLPELAAMKMEDGSAPSTPITIKHLLTHTAGLPENTREETRAAKDLQALVADFSTKPLRFQPGSKWEYSQTAINSAARIVEVVSGRRYEDYLDERIFRPLGMTDTTFYPSADQQKRLARSYRRTDDGQLRPAEIFVFAGRDLAERDRVPLANGGLFSTAGDYAKFAQMLLNDGTFGGRQLLKPESVQLLRTVHTGELKTGFTPGTGWGLGVCIVREPQGITEALSPGSYGHGGAYGTQAWIDPTKKLAYLLMVQRANFPNSDASDLRKAMQDAAAAIAP